MNERIKTLGNLEGWSQSGTLITGDSSSGVSMQANFRNNSNNYTIQFGLQTDPGVFPNPVAEVTWSVKGNHIRRLMSVINGASIQGTGEGVKVRITDDTHLPATGQQYIVSAQVAPGSRGNSQQPVILNSFIDDPNGGVGFIRIGPLSNFNLSVPENAGVVSVMVTVADTSGPPTIVDGTDCLVRQLDFSAVTIRGYNPLEYEFVPLQPQCKSVNLLNLDAARTLIYAITWGIDG